MKSTMTSPADTRDVDEAPFITRPGLVDPYPAACFRPVVIAVPEEMDLHPDHTLSV